MNEIEVWPERMPVPSRGNHRRVDEGACVMEYAALLSGQAHTDHPVQVHPYLAGLCRRVNDMVGDEARAEMVRLVPALLGTGSGGGRGLMAEPGFGAVVEVFRRNLLRRGGPPTSPPSPEPWSVPPDRIDPGSGGGTAVLDRPVEVPVRSTLVWVNRAFARLWQARRDDREIVELLEEMVHEVRAAEGLAPVATAGVGPPDPCT